MVSRMNLYKFNQLIMITQCTDILNEFRNFGLWILIFRYLTHWSCSHVIFLIRNYTISAWHTCRCCSSRKRTHYRSWIQYWNWRRQVSISMYYLESLVYDILHINYCISNFLFTKYTESWSAEWTFINSISLSWLLSALIF